MQKPLMLRPVCKWAATICLLLILPSLFGGCKSLSAAELDTARKSPESLSAAILEAYRAQDLKAFTQLAMSPSEIKKMMAEIVLPESARREAIHSKTKFVQQIQDSLQHVLTAIAIDWSTANTGHFIPARKPVEIAPGYKICMGTLSFKSLDRFVSQPLTLVEASGGKFFVGDFGPFVVEDRP